MKFLIRRLHEPSTWRGLVLLLTAFGVGLSPEQKEVIIGLGLAIVGALGAFVPDTFGKGLPLEPPPAAPVE
jgi:hypothetical protein